MPPPPSPLQGFEEFCTSVGLHLEPFQRRIVRAALTGPPELLVLLPRGNGKTTLLAALAVHHLLTTPEPAAYVAAASRDQARVLYEAARRFAERADGDLVVRHLELRAPEGHLRVLAADGPLLHGLTPSLAIVDELHAHRDAEVYLALRTAMLKRPDARMVTISTAGHGPDTPLGRLRTRALAQPKITRRGALTTATGPDLAMLEWATSDQTPLDDDTAAKQANPASWITPRALRSQREALPPLAYARYHLNQWVGPEGAWLPPGAWQACIGEPTINPGDRIWIGVDIGGERAATAVVWITEHLHVGCAIHHGDQGVLDAITDIEALADTHTLTEVAFDPWRFGQAAQELQARGIPVLAFPQTDARMIPASDRLYRAITEQRLTLPNNTELTNHAHNAIARHNRRGWRLDKAHRSDQIDGVIALAMALERAEHQPAPIRLLGVI